MPRETTRRGTLGIDIMEEAEEIDTMGTEVVDITASLTEVEVAGMEATIQGRGRTGSVMVAMEAIRDMEEERGMRETKMTMWTWIMSLTLIGQEVRVT